MALQTSSPGATRTMERLEELARIGRVPGGGTTRGGLSGAEQEACDLVAEWMREAGLETSTDGAGNLFGRRPGAAGRAVWAGSHLDTVPSGGAFDGPLGVLAALEAVAAQPAGADVTVVAFRDEEGWRFGRGCFGSRAVCRDLTEADLAATDAEGVSIAAAMEALGLPGIASAAEPPATYVELHIEQGPVLDHEDVPLAAVGAIAGMAGFTVRFDGDSGHAGTVPMDERRDAFSACAAFALRLRDAALDIPGAVATIGNVRIPDPASNRIPGAVEVTADVRAPAAAGLAALCDSVPACAAQAALRHGCGVDISCGWRDEPVPLSARVQREARAAAAGLGVAMLDLASGAGHDAGVLAAAGVDSGMVFVRSRNGGVSHRPDELTDEADVAAAIAVLTQTLERLA